MQNQTNLQYRRCTHVKKGQLDISTYWHYNFSVSYILTDDSNSSALKEKHVSEIW